MKIYLNLTNGLEYLKELPSYKWKFVRIQSTKCEQKDWNFIIEDLDYEFLFDVGRGEIVYVFDKSERKEMSRALYQGLEWIKYVLNRRWLGKIIVPKVKDNNVSTYFDIQYNKLSRRAKKKLDYVKKFITSNCINIIPIQTSKSTYSNDVEMFKLLLEKSKKWNY